jgi:hypothetical protein
VERSVNGWRHALLGCWLLGIAAGPVAAQDLARVELSGGYALSNDGDFIGLWPLGWFVGAAWPATGSLAVSGELTNNRRHETLARARADASAWNALFGVRATRRLRPSLTAFVRGTAGVAYVTDHVYVTSPPLDLPSFDVTVAITAPAVQFGGGADVDLGTRVSLRTLVEYKRIFDRRLQTLRLRAQGSLEVRTGLAIRLGSR